MKNSASKLWRHIANQSPKTRSKGPKISQSVKSDHSRKKSKIKYFPCQSDQNSPTEPKSPKLDISQIKKKCQEEPDGEVTNKAGWNQQENLENLLYEFSQNDQNQDISIIHIKQAEVRQGIECRFRHTCKMFQSILKSLKLQISMLKKATFKELEKQKIIHTHFLAEFEKKRKQFQQQFKINQSQVSENRTKVAQIMAHLAERQFQDRKLRGQLLSTQLRITELIQQINRIKQKYDKQLKWQTEEKIRISQQKNQMKGQIEELHRKIAILNAQIEDQTKNSQQICFQTSRLKASRSCNQLNIFSEKDEKSSRTKIESTQVFQVVQKHSSLQNQMLTSRHPEDSAIWLIQGEQDCPKIARSQVYASDGVQQSEPPAEQHRSVKRYLTSIQRKSMVPTRLSSVHLTQQRSPNKVGQKLKQLRSQIADQLKVLKSSISTNI